MQLLISCAKTMAEAPAVTPPRTTRPRFAAEADRLASHLAALPADELGRLLRVNAGLAAENRRRYLRFHDAPAHAALTAYTGVVFRHIAPERFTPEDFEYAQQHLHITSFLYGLLRPLDAIRSYRLEGDVVLPGEECSAFDFWRARLTDGLLDAIRADDGVLVNLASSEMKRLFDWKRICREFRVIEPRFQLDEGGRLRTAVVYTKMCRGEMTRQLLCGRATDPEALRDCTWEGFRFDEARSTPNSPLFTM